MERLPCDFARWGMTMYVVNTGGSHADLTEDYTAIPREMRAVAAQFGCWVLREVDPAEFYAGLPGLRGKVSDRAILRAMHFFEENERCPGWRQLWEPTAEHYLEEMLASGESSMEKLQNIYPADPNERGLALALFAMPAGTGRLWRLAGTAAALPVSTGTGAKRARSGLSAGNAGDLWRRKLYPFDCSCGRCV